MADGLRLVTAAGAFLAAALFSAVGGPAPSSAVLAPESRFTDLFGKTCEPDPAGLQESARDAQVKSCPGFGGARVVVSARFDRVAIGFEWSPREAAENVLREWSLGGRLEWRGLRNPRGFEPYAALLPVVVNDGTGPADDSPLLAILRLRRGEACLLGLIDPAGNPDAYGLARQLADGHARSFVCGRDPSRVEGVSTPRATTLLARS